MFSNLISEPIADFLKSVIAAIGDTILKLGVGASSLAPYWHEPWAEGARGVIVPIAWSILILRVTTDALRLYIARDAGEAILAPGILFRRSIMAAVSIPATAYMVDTAATLSRYVAGGIASVGTAPDLESWFRAFVGDVTTGALLGLGPQALAGRLAVYLVIVLVLAIGVALLSIQAAIRSVELTVAYVVGPALAVSVAGNDDALASGTFAAFWREVLVLTLTQVVQILLLLGIVNLTIAKGGDWSSLARAIAVIWVAVKAPSMLRQYAYSSGISQAATSAGMHTVMTVLSKLPW